MFDDEVRVTEKKQPPSKVSTGPSTTKIVTNKPVTTNPVATKPATPKPVIKFITIQPHPGCVYKAVVETEVEETSSSASRKIFINVFHHSAVALDDVHSLDAIEVEDKGGLRWPLYHTVICSKHFETNAFDSDKVSYPLFDHFVVVILVL